MLKFKVGDKVKITSGKDRAREGQIERIVAMGTRALVPGINIYKKHVKGVPGQKGGIYEIPRPVAFSNLAVVCPKCSKPTRVGFKVTDGGKVRICRKCGREMDKK
ncbi:50S ribosomal protein L24 [Candidatus Woesebacteria bacterium RIFCSPHIGHO2_01_FULL_39_17]|uniref:Large ribosomal subunit protein uL24 n=4 Tax=Microgenomates group TaxID=1794810 RepID=A0A0H4TDK6_9BACT|nr:50S ribosomal protein L24, large subunit ribosomal protein L24 [uncultured Microgenomates bacterium Rifle_16ft_4_minimus_954]KKQ51949.1 MAG: ribosomal protein L24, large subunit ribosomal protein L24 [Microgenomates group bacterium GW2011_GWC1_38_12]KKQ94387.1 MAG: 50S ribosomal protein L24 [Candidatus Woesebacteria bacterium GW2011_GWB1_39_10b]KKR14399.1 MAG: 50S ribosomal protein L24 [Candidatus Woesebacteria bacterium GW2011_GWA1_39_21b]OGM23802.1 MAG: 50S ribosomal protein L24 [Candidatu